MKKSAGVLFLSGVGMLLCGQEAWAQAKNKKAKAAPANASAPKADPGSGVSATTFSETHKKWIVAGYSVLPANERPSSWPKNGHLGSGPKLQRGGKVPAGWLEKLQPFPPAIDQRMALDPPGVRRGYMEGYAVIVNTQTGTLLDVHPLFPE